MNRSTDEAKRSYFFKVICPAQVVSRQKLDNGNYFVLFVDAFDRHKNISAVSKKIFCAVVFLATYCTGKYVLPLYVQSPVDVINLYRVGRSIVD